MHKNGKTKAERALQGLMLIAHSVDVDVECVCGPWQRVHHGSLADERQEKAATRQQMLTVTSHEFRRHHDRVAVDPQVLEDVLVRSVWTCVDYVVRLCQAQLYMEPLLSQAEARKPLVLAANQS